MSTGHDDDALSWGGDDDPTLAGGRRPQPSTNGQPARAAADASRPPADRAPLGNAALVGIGMIAAALILFSIGWLIVSLRLQGVAAELPVPAATLVAISLTAAAAPLVWLVTALALTRRSRTWVRFVWLLAGVVLLVPWPFLTGALG